MSTHNEREEATVDTGGHQVFKKERSDRSKENKKNIVLSK